MNGRGTPTPLQISIYVLTAAVLVMLLRDARAIAVPVLTAAFLAVLGFPLYRWLRARRVPDGAAATLVILTMLAALFLTGFIMTTSLQQLSGRIPAYQATIDQRLTEMLGDENAAGGLRPLLSMIEPDLRLGPVITGIITELLGVLGNTLIILVITAFMLLEAASLPDKLTAAFGESRRRDQMFDSFSEGLVRYAGLKSIICLATGLAAGLFTWALGLDVPLLLGFLAFVLNYIPNIGSWLAGIPAVVLGFVAFGPAGVLVVALGYLALNTLISNIIEPRVMGQSLDLSPLVIFVALMAFGWMLGPVGVILAIPLTMTVRLALESHPATQPLAMLMQSVSSLRQ